jgi:hypothetical protein
MDRIGDWTMADHRALGRLGWAFGAITAVVLLTAAAVVTSHPARSANAGASQFVATAAPSSTAH